MTVAEAFLSCARVYAGDEITNGLDSAVALDVVRFFVRWARETGGTFITALQAPTPEITAAFDAVLVLAEGRVIYHVSDHCGSREQRLELRLLLSSCPFQ